MPRHARFVQIACVLYLIFSNDGGLVFADGGLPVPFYKEVSSTTSIWHFLFCFYYRILLPIFFATVAIEYLVVYLYLGRPSKAKTHLLLYIILINLITNPAAQLSMLFIGDPKLLGSSALSCLVDCTTELAVVAIEFGFMIWMFRRMYDRGILEKVTTGKTALMALVANVASFVIVFIGITFMIAFLGT